MAVDVEVRDVAVELGALGVGQGAEPGQVVAVVEVLAVLLIETLARRDLLGQLGLAVLTERHTSSVRGPSQLLVPSPACVSVDDISHHSTRNAPLNADSHLTRLTYR